MQTFWQKGYAGTSVDDLCAATGLNKPSLYAGLGDKQRLYHQALQAYVQQVGAGEIGGDVHATISPAVREVRHRGGLGGAQAAGRALDGEVSHERQTATARRPSQWRSAGPCVAPDAI